MSKPFLLTRITCYRDAMEWAVFHFGKREGVAVQCSFKRSERVCTETNTPARPLPAEFSRAVRLTWRRESVDTPPPPRPKEMAFDLSGSYYLAWDAVVPLLRI
ncbi:hypothetical protein SKAU_G00041810 [Synaphobranchus kaupii]|uniref:Uncharacterized protein n=1 Tax=Synaphobranchus kaupii TaxID=118154 RepID=A0A9Q1G1P1_SYNKA|nr:hypothetical protein SKAU_G00041810 [Synaphobranchus kaupii]